LKTDAIQVHTFEKAASMYYFDGTTSQRHTTED